jgi:nickel/cobalt exporter
MSTIKVRAMHDCSLSPVLATFRKSPLAPLFQRGGIAGVLTLPLLKRETGGFFSQAQSSSTTIRRIVLALSFLCQLALAGSAHAHPLGNFSVNQYSALTVGDSIALRYVVDMAEIPTFQELQTNSITASADHPDTRAYLERQVRVLGDGLSMELSGESLRLRADSSEIIFPPGAGGLPTLRIMLSFVADRPKVGTAGTYSLSYHDGNFPGRAGWKEIIARSAPGAELTFSSVPEVDRSAELSNYAADVLNSPPQQLEAHIVFSTATRSSVPDANKSLSSAGAVATGSSSQAPLQTAPVQKGNDNRAHANETWASVDPPATNLEQLQNAKLTQPQITKSLTPRDSFTELMTAQAGGSSFLLFAFIVAVGLGAFHALEPGHGKTLVAAYLVGSKGTVRQALLLGLIVTTAHTAGVYLLGAFALYASRYVVPERLYPFLEIVSGVMIAVLGTTLLIKRYLSKHSGHSHHHHRHEHSDHSHGHEHEHDHEKYGSASPRELLTLGVSGGIVPCPAALVVLLSAISMNRTGFGLVLIVAFSAGLAAVLIAIGMLMVCARHFMSRFQSENPWMHRWLPITSSALIVFLGLTLIWKSLQSAGFARWMV